MYMGAVNTVDQGTIDQKRSTLTYKYGRSRVCVCVIDGNLSRYSPSKPLMASAKEVPLGSPHSTGAVPTAVYAFPAADNALPTSSALR